MIQSINQISIINSLNNTNSSKFLCTITIMDIMTRLVKVLFDNTGYMLTPDNFESLFIDTIKSNDDTYSLYISSYIAILRNIKTTLLTTPTITTDPIVWNNRLSNFFTSLFSS
jgi:hypothetical protein